MRIPEDRRPASWRRGIAVASCALLAAVACQQVASGVRKVTYPPDFRYLSDAQVRSSMGKLAPMTARLDGLSRSPTGLAGHRLEVVTILREMERIASRLNPAELPTNHPLLNANLDRLRQDIYDARIAAEREPPSFGRAHSIPAACLICHATGSGD